MLDIQWFDARGALDSARSGPVTSASITKNVTDARVIQMSDPDMTPGN